MAVKTIRRSISFGALALSLVAAPTLALAQEDGGQRGWRDRSEAQAARSEQRGNDNGNRGGAGWNRPAPQQASPQSTQSSQPGGWQGRGNWAGHAQGTPTPPPAQVRNDRPGGNDGQRNWSGNGGRSWQGSGQAGAPPQPPSWRNDDNRNGRNWQGDRDGRRDGQWSSRDGDRDGRRDGDRWQGSRDGRNDGDRWRNNSGRNVWTNQRDHNRHGYDRDHRSWRRDWRHNNRYNWYSYRNHHRDIYRLRPYYAPYRNYYYRPLSIGFFLDSLFFSNRYWINDPWRYRLPEVYGPYRWVRYYDDVLLVDIYSGEVVDVIRDFFW